MTRRITALEKLVIEQQSNVETTFQTQQTILDQATKDSTIAITTIKNDIIAQRDMINKRLEKNKEQNKNMERLANLADQKQHDLMDTINKANKTGQDHNKFMTDLKDQKEKIKTDLKAYTPKSLDADIKQVSQDLDDALKETKSKLTIITKSVEQHFKQKIADQSKKELANHTENELVGAIDEANKVLGKLDESTHLSEVRCLQANHAAKTRISEFLESKQVKTVINEQA